LSSLLPVVCGFHQPDETKYPISYKVVSSRPPNAGPIAGSVGANHALGLIRQSVAKDKTIATKAPSLSRHLLDSCVCIQKERMFFPNYRTTQFGHGNAARADCGTVAYY